uniref:(northern house mosquito) hypothetical protein n=1 Tax=Culex pipiens TaxID=7175 RepID=A0A8D8A2Y3_CULPI
MPGSLHRQVGRKNGNAWSVRSAAWHLVTVTVLQATGTGPHTRGMISRMAEHDGSSKQSCLANIQFKIAIAVLIFDPSIRTTKTNLSSVTSMMICSVFSLLVCVSVFLFVVVFSPRPHVPGVSRVHFQPRRRFTLVSRGMVFLCFCFSFHRRKMRLQDDACGL